MALILPNDVNGEPMSGETFSVRMVSILRQPRNASGTSSKSDDPEIYIIEVNPRSSRTIPFISKVTRIPMVRIATEVMRG
ncbi:MAG: hypothetical protein QF820_10915, partial [Acidimicrobiales bacterium]|nr:hypothetical protein [Acidimicrobiales bacterium]